MYYAITQNTRESAARAGYGVLSELAGMRLLAREEIRERISALEEERPRTNSIRAGLERLAFGSISDAVKLLFTDTAELDAKALDSMELFCVSEIKRQKGGAVEIKFFDRLRALEKLLNLSGEQEKGAAPFYKAVLEGAKNLYSEEDGRTIGI